MIETSDFKIAENSEEAFWKKLEKEMTERIITLKREILISQEILAFAISKQEKQGDE